MRSTASASARWRSRWCAATRPRSQEERTKVEALWVNEMRLAGRLNHPYILEVYEAGTEGDLSFLVMEYLPGGTLKSHAEPHTLLPIPRVADIIFKVCHALEYANTEGLLHRDIKPANVLLAADGTPKVSDFGAVYLTGSDETQVIGVGTLPFMPPEHFEGAAPHVQSDIYAVGRDGVQPAHGRVAAQGDIAGGDDLREAARRADPDRDAPPRCARRPARRGLSARCIATGACATNRGRYSAKCSPPPSPRSATSPPPPTRARSSRRCGPALLLAFLGNRTVGSRAHGRAPPLRAQGRGDRRRLRRQHGVRGAVGRAGGGASRRAHRAHPRGRRLRRDRVHRGLRPAALGLGAVGDSDLRHRLPCRVAQEGLAGVAGGVREARSWGCWCGG